MADGKACKTVVEDIVLEVRGKLGWSAAYFKEVDAKEVTIRFWQEIYDSSGRLSEIHEKYPMDKGHQIL